MSFLNSASIAPKDAEAVRAAINPVIAAYMREHCGIDKGPEAVITEWIEQIGAGQTTAAALGLTQDHIDAILSQARDLIRTGHLDKARDKLLLALLLNPLEVRAVYASAASLQMEQRYVDAGRLYASYIVLNPLESVGYLRMGECLLGSGSPDDAREFIGSALSLARENQDAATVEHAEKLLNFIDDNRAVIRVRAASPASDSAQ